jgi:hypothetical protein
MDPAQRADFNLLRPGKVQYQSVDPRLFSVLWHKIEIKPADILA